MLPPGGRYWLLIKKTDLERERERERKKERGDVPLKDKDNINNK